MTQPATTPQSEVYEIEDIRVLEAVTAPTRLRLLHHLLQPATLRDVAERMAVPVTRLYYHVGLLEELGVVRVVETRKSGARLQRVYQTTASRFKPAKKLLEETEDRERLAEAAAGAVLDGARLDAVAGLTALFRAGGSTPDDPGTLGRTMARLRLEHALEFSERIGALVDEMTEMEDPDGDEYGFSFVFFPLVGPVRGEI